MTAPGAPAAHPPLRRAGGAAGSTASVSDSALEAVGLSRQRHAWLIERAASELGKLNDHRLVIVWGGLQRWVPQERWRRWLEAQAKINRIVAERRAKGLEELTPELRAWIIEKIAPYDALRLHEAEQRENKRWKNDGNHLSYEDQQLMTWLGAMAAQTDATAALAGS